jgi:hypothetical protein
VNDAELNASATKCCLVYQNCSELDPDLLQLGGARPIS